MDKRSKIGVALLLCGLVLVSAGLYVMDSWWETYHADDDPETWVYHELGIVCLLDGEEHVTNRPLVKIGDRTYYTGNEEMEIDYGPMTVTIMLYPGDTIEIDIMEIELDDDPAYWGYEGTIYYSPYDETYTMEIELPTRIVPLDTDRQDI